MVPPSLVMRSVIPTRPNPVPRVFFLSFGVGLAGFEVVMVTPVRLGLAVTVMVLPGLWY